VHGLVPELGCSVCVEIMGIFLRVPPSSDAGAFCLGLCEKRVWALIMALVTPAADVPSQNTVLTSAPHFGWPKGADVVMAFVVPGISRTT
jgi:hypothetical protein